MILEFEVTVDGIHESFSETIPDTALFTDQDTNKI